MTKSARKRRTGKPLVEGFACAECGKWHKGLPMDWYYDAPTYWYQLSKPERAKRALINEDFCSIDKTDFFVRGLIEIPVIGSEQSFKWGVWVSLSKGNFRRMLKLWHDLRILQEPPCFGWLSNSILGYPETLNLKTNVFSKRVEDRPYIELQSTDHPLAVEQRKGITKARVAEIASLMRHQR